MCGKWRHFVLLTAIIPTNGDWNILSQNKTGDQSVMCGWPESHCSWLSPCVSMAFVISMIWNTIRSVDFDWQSILNNYEKPKTIWINWNAIKWSKKAQFRTISWVQCDFGSSLGSTRLETWDSTRDMLLSLGTCIQKNLQQFCAKLLIFNTSFLSLVFPMKTSF